MTPENELGKTYLVLPIQNRILWHFTGRVALIILFCGSNSHSKIQKKFVQFYLFCFVKPHSISDTAVWGPVLCFCWFLKLSVFLDEWQTATKNTESLRRQQKHKTGPQVNLHSCSRPDACGCRQLLTKWKIFGICEEILKWDVLRMYTILVLLYFNEIS